MVSVSTSEFVRTTSDTNPLPFSLIETRTLGSRLFGELKGALNEFGTDPVGFIRRAFSGGAVDAKRRRRLQVGLASALMAHLALLTTIAVFGWRTVFVKTETPDRVDYVVTHVGGPLPDKSDDKPSDTPKGRSGGGGGGQEDPRPPSKGLPPISLPRPPIVNLNPSTVPDPTLAVVPSVVGPEGPPPPPAPIGDPRGKPGDFSGGPGTKGGIGKGNGTGVGDGTEGGVGPGGKGGRGGGSAGIPEGGGSGVPNAVDFNRISSLQGFRNWTWIHRPPPVITPEARANQIIGTVLMKANFNADGTVSDIEVVMPVEYMTDSAVESLRRSTFRPATINGVPITVRRVLIQVSVHY